MKPGPLARPPLERFWPKVRKEPSPSGCWIWTGAIRRGDGYGEFHARQGMSRLAHRVAYEPLVGPVPDGLQIDHLCRVRRCVNRAHLEPVTHAENVRRGSAVGATHSRGERHSMAKLTEAQVRAIRVDPRTEKALGAEYGVSSVTIHHARSGFSWGWLK